jgi:hypothetical protein
MIDSKQISPSMYDVQHDQPHILIFNTDVFCKDPKKSKSDQFGIKAEVNILYDITYKLIMGRYDLHKRNSVIS